MFESYLKPPLTFPSLTSSIVTFNAQYALPLKSHTVNIDSVSGVSAINIGSDDKYAGFINFNQLLDKNNYPASSGVFTNNGDGTWTANGTTSSTESIVLEYISDRVTVGHKYFISSGFTSVGSSSTYEFMLLRFIRSDANLNLYKNATIAECGYNNGIIAQLVVRAGTTVNNLKFIPQVIDLTEMFGSTKADEIYNMEQQTAGSGVAYFRSLFPNDYYDYNAGTLSTVSAVNGSTNSFFTIPIGQTVNEGVYDARTGILEVTLPTVQTIQLPPCPIDTLKGVNNIFADTGDTTLQYAKFG